MDLRLGELHETIRDTTRAFAQKELAPRAHTLESAESVPAEVLAQLADLGLLGLTVPEAEGGAGLDGLAFVLAVEAIATASPDVAWRLAVHAGPAVAALAGTDRGALAEGTRLATYGHAAHGVARLVPLPADVLVARDPAGGLVRLDAPGGEAVATLGLAGAGLGDVPLEGATPLAADVAEVEAWADLAAAATMLGAASGAARAAVRYAKERTQFGKPLGEFQAIQWKIADAATDLDAARLLVWRAGAGLTAAAAAAARAFTASRAARVCHDALQVHGGYGFTKEYPVERPLRAVRMLAARDPARARVAAVELA